MSTSLRIHPTSRPWSCSPTLPTQASALQPRRTCLRVSASAISQKGSSSGITVKICGLTSASDARLAAEQGADLLGFLLWPKGKRAVSIGTAKQIVAIAREHGIESAALFVDEDAASIAAMCMEVGATYAQLHGDNAREALPDLPSTQQVIYAMHATPEGELQTATPQQLQRSLGRSEPRSVLVSLLSMLQLQTMVLHNDRRPAYMRPLACVKGTGFMSCNHKAPTKLWPGDGQGCGLGSHRQHERWKWAGLRLVRA